MQAFHFPKLRVLSLIQNLQEKDKITEASLMTTQRFYFVILGKSPAAAA